MKICLVSQEYPPETGGGGIGTQTYLKAQGLAARGHEVHVISLSGDGIPRMYADGPVVVHRIVHPELDAPGFELTTSWMAYSGAVARKLQELDSGVHFEIIQFPEYGGEGFVYQTDTFGNRTARYVVQLHGPLGMFAEQMGWPDVGSTFHQIGCFMERSAMHHADKVLASSLNTARFCAEHYDYPLREIDVIHSAVDTLHFKPRQVEGPGHPNVLFVGNLHGSKGIDVLMDAVISLRRKFPRIRLRCIGKADASSMAEHRQRIAAGVAGENIEILGYVHHSDLPAYYQACDIFAAPSVFEPGPGNIYLEAMACGKPVIACRSGGAPEVVLDGETGILVPPVNAEAIAEAIVLLEADTAYRRRLGGNGRKWVESRFTRDQYINRVERIYSGLLQVTCAAV